MSPGCLRALVLPLLAAASLAASAYAFGVSFPSDCDQPTTSSCPACCKNLRNLVPAGDPSVVKRKVKNIDTCIALCANHTYYALSNKQVCGCFDDCSVIEVPPSPFAVTSGLVSACLGSCFEPSPGAAPCACPEHASCLPLGQGIFKCCCKQPLVPVQRLGGDTECMRSYSELD